MAMDSGQASPYNTAVDAADRQDVQASLAGDGEAFARIVRRHQQHLARRMWRFTRDRHELEELVQEVFVQAYFSLPRYRAAAPLEHWLRRIATRVGYRFWKRRKASTPAVLSLRDWDGPEARGPGSLKRPGRDGLGSVEAAGGAEATGGVELLVRREQAQIAAEAVHELLSCLGPRDRLVLTLLYLEGCTVQRAADLTGWSRIMVKVQAHRARKRLRAMLVKSGGLRGSTKDD